MKKVIAFYLCVLFATAISAQSSTNEKLSVSVEVGGGYLFGTSNLSSYGIDYRGEYNNGFSGNIKAAYLFDKVFQAGVKFNLFSVAENYETARGNLIADDIELIYIAPQIGYRKMISPNWCFDFMVGAGYMNYQSKSLYDSVERECNKGFFAANADISISRQLFKNLYMGANVAVTGGNTSSLKEKVEGQTETLKLGKWDHIKVMRADVMLSIKALF